MAPRKKDGRGSRPGAGQSGRLPAKAGQGAVGEPLCGPRGGTTTVFKSGLIRKTLMLGVEEERRLRRMAFDTQRSEADIAREALRRFFGLEP
jgi:hypothetical protein